jgi:hypothetical protein
MQETDNTQVDTNLSDDRGDETSNRFRYQYVISAIICCMLLDENEDVKEVFCEHHEDVLIKHNNALFTGIQIKTRADNQPLWNASDETVIDSFARFVILDNQYINQFQSFKFITNHPIQSSRNGKDISFLLEKIKESTNYSLSNRSIGIFIKKISKKSKINEEKVFFTLKKVMISHDFPKLRDATVRLKNDIYTVWDKAKSISYEGIGRASRNLVNECFQASSLASQDTLPAYLGISSSGKEKEIKNRVTGKTFTKQRVYDTLLQGLDETIPLSCDPMDLEDICTENTELLRKKLTAGGFSAVSIGYAEELRNTADYAGLCLMQKYGHKQGLQKYYELSLKVYGDAANAYEIKNKNTVKFGFDMLLTLKENIKNRFLSGEQLYGYTKEHLEGLAYSLTSQCKILWSIDRPWEVK